jgi:hypothetical protein
MAVAHGERFVSETTMAHPSLSISGLWPSEKTAAARRQIIARPGSAAPTSPITQRIGSRVLNGHDALSLEKPFPRAGRTGSSDRRDQLLSVYTEHFECVSTFSIFSRMSRPCRHPQLPATTNYRHTYTDMTSDEKCPFYGSKKRVSVTGRNFFSRCAR